MAVYVKLELTAYLLGIDYSGYFCSPFVKQCQYCFIHIIIYKDNASLRTLKGQSENSVAILLSGYSFVSLRHETMASITDSIS